MDASKKLISLLIKTGMKPVEAELYVFMLNNEGSSIMNFCNITGNSRSSAYRAYESLRHEGLAKNENKDWRRELKATSLMFYIKNLENICRSEKHVIKQLKLLNQVKEMSSKNGSTTFIENYYGQEVVDRYLELSELNFEHLFVFGNWEDFNDKKSLVSSEKKFIKNRFKMGAECTLYLTKGGDHTSEIIDYDKYENRSTKMVDALSPKPLWINTFDSNDIVYIWNKTEDNKMTSTLIKSKQVSDFYKDFIFSHSH